MKFDHKVILCNYSDHPKEIEEAEEEWIYSLLLRFKVDPKVIKKHRKDDDFKSEWRNFLFDTYGIRISKNIVSGEVLITRIDFRTFKTVKLGVWKKPEVVRVRNKKENHCEVRLNYWNII